ncbi:MAG: hypothetical protein KTR31_35740 [Myxococcales bacterium]|nr:hypothetical protein [Myxococcales bacterium]
MLLVMLGACNIDPQETDPVQTGANLTLDYFADTDVQGFHFEITPVSCGAGSAVVGDVIRANADLVNGIFPGNIDLVSTVLDLESNHVGSDLFLTLEPGCYDVLAVPAAALYADGTWDPSEDCAAASHEGAVVVAGLTTDVTLISQCAGDPVGGLDISVVLNHAPEIGDPVANLQAAECETVRVCAEVFDVDDNPLRVTWTQTSGTDVYEIEADPIEVVDFLSGHRLWQACAHITTEALEAHQFELKVYDVFTDGSDFEDLVDGPSHDRDLFTIETVYRDDDLCFDEHGDLVDAGDGLQRAKGCSYVQAEEWWCSGDYEVNTTIQDAVCDVYGNLDEAALYPECA